MTDWTAALCRFAGVGTQYRGYEGEEITVPPEIARAVLAALGHDAPTESAAKACLTELEMARVAHPCPGDVIVPVGAPSTATVSKPVEWVLEAEADGAELAAGRATDTVELPPLPLGIHRLILRSDGAEWQTWVLARPDRAVSLEDATGAERIWGVTAALYGLTDAGRHALGTYDTLAAYGAALARQGVDFLGVNPVHAMGGTRPGDVISPYSPSHRGFLNPWHLALPDPAPALKGGALIDYPAALEAAGTAARAAYNAFTALPDTVPDRADFSAFCAETGSALEDYALFEVLAARHGPDWRDWPDAYRTRDPGALAQARTQNADEIGLEMWAQWQADCQLAQAQSRLTNAGMRLGLYLDLAVGPRLGGAETWAADSALVTGASLGAPADALSPTGQHWGLAPLSPTHSRAEGYRGFSRLLRAVMRHAGMIRIDHVIGLMRSYWIPEGTEQGAYVSHPMASLLAVVAIESARTGTVVIGEDLGLVPEGLRAALDGAGLYGMEVLQFMRNAQGGFVDTTQIRPRALCAFATHDTPTIAGFFAAEDVRLHAALGAMAPETRTRIETDRAKAAASLGTDEPIAEIHRRLARSNCAMVAVQLDDIAGQRDQQNLPGTVDEHPNWRRPAPLGLDDLATSRPLAALSAEMAAAGRANPNLNGEGP